MKKVEFYRRNGLTLNTEQAASLLGITLIEFNRAARAPEFPRPNSHGHWIVAELLAYAESRRLKTCRS